MLVAALALSPMAQAVITTVAASTAHTVMIDNGNVYTTGLNAWGEVVPTYDNVLKSPNLSSTFTTFQYTNIQNVKSVAAAYGRTAVLKNDGTVVVWGMVNKKSGYFIDTNLTGVTDIAITMDKLFYLVNCELYMWVNGELTVA